MNEINLATSIAALYTDGRTTKDGLPSILHALEVGTLLKQDGQDFLIAAGILHDVLEDSEGMYTPEKLRAAGMGDRTVVLIEHLTRLPHPIETHTQFINDIIEAGYGPIRIEQADCISNLRPATFGGSDSLRERTLKTLELLASYEALPDVWIGHFNIRYALDTCKDQSKYPILSRAKALWDTGHG